MSMLIIARALTHSEGKDTPDYQDQESQMRLTENKNFKSVK